jgi:hypothetical protein
MFIADEIDKAIHKEQPDSPLAPAEKLSPPFLMRLVAHGGPPQSNDVRTARIIPGEIPGLCAAIPGISPHFCSIFVPGRARRDVAESLYLRGFY